ncbi:hypothetical protein D9Q98_003707 [Chlorella vulgaris]|uniref:Uncharacterized protein n=1 Tax=Chlorella vulgaris TaxID=3077 RepID=A0A9D4TTF4_CHLVU|nr:hypothetical protein D9Q98_003707 [Chlorella vulgaris]
MGALYPPQLHLHHFVVVEAPADAANDDQEAPPPAVAVAYDFLPADASSPMTAARLLSGGSVPGVARSRTLRGVPRQRCQLAGCTVLDDPHAAAAAFQSSYADRPLQLLRNDCTHHVERLLQHLLQPP